MTDGKAQQADRGGVRQPKDNGLSTVERTTQNLLRFWPWTIAAPFAALAIVAFLTVLDPFGFDDSTRGYSTNIFYKLYGADYPNRARSEISVVLIDDSALTKRNDPWPPSHMVHGQVLEAILTYAPAAVLVDMFFLNPRPGDRFEVTEAAIKRYNSSSVPLFFVEQDDPTQPSVRPELQALADKHLVGLVSGAIEGERGARPLYPLHTDNNGREPAALALYRATCDRLAYRICQDIPDHEREHMEVVWGLVPDDSNCKRASNWPRQVCADTPASALLRAFQLLWAGINPRDWRGVDPMPIPYHPLISADDVLDGTKRDALQGLLRGKVVIYAADILAQRDEVFSPVHGSVNGAFFHAMALDNLLTYGNKYIYRDTSGDRFIKDWTEYQPTILMSVVCLSVFLRRMVLLMRKSSEWRQDQASVDSLRRADERCAWWTWWTLVTVILILGWCEFFYLRISPFNWLGLLVAVHFADLVDKWFFSSVERRVSIERGTRPVAGGGDD